MDVVIALRPQTDRGQEILEELEARYEKKPMAVMDDRTRRYHLTGEDAAPDAFNPMLDEIDPDWRSHVASWSDQLESELDEELDQEQLDEAWEEAGGD